MVNILLWNLQIVAIAIFLYSGICKAALPEKKLVP